MHNRDLGNWGEQQATDYLIKKGYDIICRNFYATQGEIDIVAKDNETIVFCEVKTRRNTSFGMPIEAVHYWKRKHFYSTAEYFLYKYKIRNIPVRFDVIEVYLINHKTTINHVKNVM